MTVINNPYKYTAIRMLTGSLPASTRMILDINKQGNKIGLINGWRLSVWDARDPAREIILAQGSGLSWKVDLNKKQYDQFLGLKERFSVGENNGIDIGSLKEHLGILRIGSLSDELEASMQGRKPLYTRLDEWSSLLNPLRLTYDLRNFLGKQLLEKYIDPFFSKIDSDSKSAQLNNFLNIKESLDPHNAEAAKQDAAYHKREILGELIKISRKEQRCVMPKFIFPPKVQEILANRIDKIVPQPYKGIDPSHHPSDELQIMNAEYVKAWEGMSNNMSQYLEDACRKGNDKKIEKLNSMLFPAGVKLVKMENGQVKMTLSGKIIIMSGPSGSGKGTVQNILLEQGILKFVIDVTRAPRTGERHGITYYYMSVEEAQKIIESGNYIAKADVHGDLQVVPKGLVDLAERGLTVFVEVDTALAMQIKNYLEAQGDYVDAHFVFLRTEDGREQEIRLAGRGTEPVEKIRTRVQNAAKEIINSSRVHDIVITNDDLYGASVELMQAIGLIDKRGNLTPRDAATVEDMPDINGERQKYQPDGESNGKDTVDSYLEIASRLRINPVGSYNIRGTNTPESEINKHELENYRNYIIEHFDPNMQGEIDDLLTKAAEHVYSTSPNRGGKARKDVRIGVHPGTMNPPTFGHLSASMAAILGHRLDAVLELPGGDVPDKPLTLPFKYRMEMLQIALSQGVHPETNESIYNPYSLPSGIRNQMVETLIDNFMGKPEFFASTDASRRAKRDIAAFVLLAKMNPDVHFTYIVGNDKVVDYANPKKNEAPLINTLAGLGWDILYFGRNGTNVNWDDLSWAKWLYDLGPKGSGMFKPSKIPSYDTSSTEVRRRVALGLPIGDIVPMSIAEFIYSSSHPCWKVYALEYKIKEMNERLAAVIKKGDKKKIEAIEKEEKPAILEEVNRLKEPGLIQKNANIANAFKYSGE